MAKGAPQKARLDFCFRTAWDLIEQLEISSFPVDPQMLLKRMNISCYTFEDVSRLTGYSRSEIMDSIIQSRDGGTLCVKGRFAVIFNERVRQPDRIRWTLTHELAHIWLGHFDIANWNSLTDLERRILDREADYVTREILAPLGVVHLLGITDPESISYIFGLSRKAAEIRAEEVVSQRNTDMLRLSTTRSAAQFERFLTPIKVCHYNERRALTLQPYSNGFNGAPAANPSGLFCIRCRTPARSRHARYCLMCGAPLYNFCGSDPEIVQKPCGHINPIEARYCELCGHETILVTLGIYERWESSIQERAPKLDDCPF